MFPNSECLIHYHFFIYQIYIVISAHHWKLVLNMKDRFISGRIFVPSFLKWNRATLGHWDNCLRCTPAWSARERTAPAGWTGRRTTSPSGWPSSDMVVVTLQIVHRKYSSGIRRRCSCTMESICTMRAECSSTSLLLMAVRTALMNMAEYTGGLLGTGHATKSDEFSEKFQGGHFQS